MKFNLRTIFFLSILSLLNFVCESPTSSNKEKESLKKHLKPLNKLTDLGWKMLRSKGHPDSAFYFFKKAEILIREHPILLSHAQNTYLGLAETCIFQRDHFKGLIYAEKAMNLAQKKTPRDSLFIGKCLNQKGRMVKKLGKLAEAEAIYYQALNLIQDKEDFEILEQRLYRNLAINYVAQNKHNQFFSILEKGKKKFPPSKRKYFFEENLLGYYYHDLKDTAKCIQYYEAFLNKYLQTNALPHLLIDQAYFMLTLHHKGLHQFEKAKDYALSNILLGKDNKNIALPQKELLSLADFNQSKSYDFVFFGQLADINLSWYLHDTTQIEKLKHAHSLSRKLDSVIFSKIISTEEDAILNYLNDFGKTFYTNALKTCSLLYQQTNNLEYLEWANIFIERMKSFIFFGDLIAKNWQDTHLQSLDIIKKEINLKSKIKALKLKKLQNILTEDQDLDNEILEILYQQSLVQNDLKKHYPSYYQKRINQSIPTLGQLKLRLQENNKAIIQYQMAAECIYTLLITKETITLTELPITPTFKKEIIAFTSIVNEKGKLETFAKLSHEIYQKIILPITPFLPKKTKEVLIIKDDVLNLIPFESLLTKSLDSLNNYTFKNLPYLLYDWQVSYSISLKLYYHNVKNLKEINRNSSILGYAYSNFNHQKNTLSRNRIIEEQELFYSSDELATIDEVFQHRDKRLRYKEQSSKSDFLEHYKNKYDIIHFALHAQSNYQEKLDNRIIFRKKNTNSSHYLYGFEILSLNIPAQLIYISSCQTAVGASFPGEGVYSLTRAFFLAGAKRVISSLWKIDDYTSSKIAQFFYKAISLDKQPTAALQLAKINYLENINKELAHPKYWAGLVIFN